MAALRIGGSSSADGASAGAGAGGGSSSSGIAFIGFNQDHACFTAGMESGFRIYNADPLKERLREGAGVCLCDDAGTDFAESVDGGIGYIEMLFRTNYIALVGGGRNPKYPPNEVVIWDDVKKKPVIELKFKTDVKAVKLRRDRIVVVLSNKVVVHSFTNTPQRLSAFETCENDAGVCALCPSTSNALLAFPSKTVGQVQIVDIGAARKFSSVIKAHESSISCLALSADGARVATTSEKGTLVRVFDTTSANKLMELRRGVDNCTIRSLCFNFDTTRIAVTSDKGTVHIFVLDANKNRTSSLAFMGDMVKYLASEWSFAHFSVGDSNSVAAFGTGAEKNAIIVVCGDGNYYKYVIDPATGNCTREVAYNFLALAED